MEVKLRTFEELSRRELYQILQLREKVYTFEQKCTDRDIDGEDPYTRHLFIEDRGNVIGCARFFEPGQREQQDFVLGRLVVAKAYRRQGLSRQLIEKFLEYVENAALNRAVVLSSQYYIRDFYKKYGFVETGQMYDEGGIDHIKMIRPA